MVNLVIDLLVSNLFKRRRKRREERVISALDQLNGSLFWEDPHTKLAVTRKVFLEVV